MCGRYGDEFDEHHFLERWGFERPEFARVGPQMAPTDPVTVVDTRRAQSARWGLLPSNAASLKEAKRGSKINAPAEALTRNPMFVEAMQTRVLVPATHWFEWRTVNGVKTPYVIRRRDRDYMAFAGVTSRWANPDNGEVLTCTAIVTCAAHGWMNDIHSRMPLVLTLESEGIWLNADLPRKELRDRVLLDDVLADLTVYPVAAITSPTQSDPEMLVPVGTAIH